jgi:hypothetical protein
MGNRPNIESHLRYSGTTQRGVFNVSSSPLPTVQDIPDPRERTIQFAHKLLDKNNSIVPGVSLKPWQHSRFNIDTGYIEAGGQRVMRRNYDSLHHSDKALDYPLSHNSAADLDKAYAFLKANQKQLGIVELFWRSAGHHDHLHVAFE